MNKYGWIPALAAVCLLAAGGATALTTLEEVQKAIAESGAVWTAEENEISARGEEAFRAMLGLLPGEPSPDAPAYVAPFGRDLPSRFTWKDIDGCDYMTRPEDQAACGSCWAMAAVSCIEGIAQIREELPFQDLDLSEQFIVSCYAGGGCSGGSIYGAYSFVTTTGLPDEECMPYQASDAIPCASACPDWEERAWHIDGYTTVANSIIEIKNAVYDHGPVACSMIVYQDFMYYTGGVYLHTWGSQLEGHAVAICGWEDENLCWICKNSWGPGWGEDGGYFRIRWGTCGIGGSAAFPNHVHSEPWPHLVECQQSPAPLGYSGSLTVTADFLATNETGGIITSAEVFVDAPALPGMGTSLAPADGAFDGPEETATATLSGLGFAPGTAHVLYFSARGADGTWGDPLRSSVPVMNCQATEYAEAEAGDTEYRSVDLRAAAFFVDGDSLRIWIDMERDRWSNIDLGVAIDVNTPGGGTTDIAGRSISWENMALKPDYMLYNWLDNGYQQLRAWDGDSWERIHYGYHALGWQQTGSLFTVAVALSDIGSPQEGDVLHYEIWTCRNKTSSGALDLMASDGEQESTPAGTLWELPEGTTTQPDTWLTYVVGETTAAPAPDVAGAPRLLGAWPNPFNPETSFAFSLPAPARVRLEILTPAGRLAAVAADADYPAGRHDLSWRADGLASGVYLARLKVDGRQAGLLKVALTK